MSSSFSLLVLEFIGSSPQLLEKASPSIIQILQQKIAEPSFLPQRYDFLARNAIQEETVRKIPGVYVIIRPDTGEKSLVQEILVLVLFGSGLDQGLALSLGAEGIGRGRWVAVKNIINVSIGIRDRNSHSSLVTFAIVPNFSSFKKNETEILPGALLGSATGNLLPAFAPAVFVRAVRELSEDFVNKTLARTDSDWRLIMDDLNYYMSSGAEASMLVRQLLNELVKGPTANPADGTVVNPDSGMMATFRDSRYLAQNLILPEVLAVIMKIHSH